MVYTSKNDKGVMFFSCGSPKDARSILDTGINDILVSYFYLRKAKGAFKDIVEEIRIKKGYFMTDSGGFSFINTTKVKSDEMYTEEYWLPYLNEYVQWLHDNHRYIFVAANLDLDAYVGRDVVDKWNDKYFKPLEKHTNIVYVTQRDFEKEYDDFTGIKRLKEYLSLHDYVGVNNAMTKYTSQIFSLNKVYNKRIHGFGWTSLPMLKSQPLFSVDSTTWTAGAQFGATFIDDGKNFRRYDGAKHLRKRLKLKIEDAGLDAQKIAADKGEEVNRMNLLSWKGAQREYLRIANVKLINKPVAYYDKRFGA